MNKGDSMKRLTTAALLLALGTVALAHGNNDHVRGVVTQISAQSITVQLANKTSKTLVCNTKTTFERAGKPAKMGDLKVGDRVVIDVPKNTNEALEVQIGTAPAAAAKTAPVAAQAPKGNTTEHAFRGVVQKVDAKAKTLMVDGENVPGWMTAMTMAYSADKEDVYTKVKPGDQITAKVHDGDLKTLYGVEVVPPKGSPKK